MSAFTVGQKILRPNWLTDAFYLVFNRWFISFGIALLMLPVLAHQLALLMDGAIVAAMVSRNPRVADTAALAAAPLLSQPKARKTRRATAAAPQLFAV